MSKKILIVDDDKLQRNMLDTLIQRKLESNITLQAENGRQALDILAQTNTHHIGLVILDMNMPVLDGMQTLVQIKEKHPHMPVIMLTGNTSLHDAVQAMKAGATDFIAKPYQGERMIITIQNCMKLGVLTEEISRLKREKDGTFGFENMIGWDSGLKHCVRMGQKAAQADIPVLITGATGSGKEVFARAIHGQSARAGRAFIAVNCGAIPAQLVESTLFGHEKGAFTGATEKAAGKFREAGGGTIFLDEVGELPLEAQVKLLRVLQQKEVEPVGAATPVPVNVRILSATNRDLQAEVQKGNFREDLYFRLNVVHIDLPDLGRRKQDIPALVSYFTERFCAGAGIPSIHIPPQTLAHLAARGWPGNVRELENAINRALVMREHDSLLPEDFSVHTHEENIIHHAPPSTQHNFFLDENGAFKSLATIEYQALQAALSHCEGNITAAAKCLGMAKSTFYRKIEEYAALNGAP